MNQQIVGKQGNTNHRLGDEETSGMVVINSMLLYIGDILLRQKIA